MILLKQTHYLLIFCSLFLTCYNQVELVAQVDNPYVIKGKLDIPLMLGSGLAVTISAKKFKNKPFLNTDELDALDPSTLKGIDTWAFKRKSIQAQQASDILLVTSPIAPLLLLADKDARNHAGQIGFFFLEVGFINYSLTALTKELVKRKRPYLYDRELPYEIRQSPAATSSFYSGHAALSAGFYFMSAKMFQDFNPDSKLRPFVWGTAAVVPAITGFLRVRGGKHYPTDVIVGYLVGAAVGILIPQVHKRKLN
ncbi:MAG: phosphatase PAP2 family protein [Chitinophagales bacterium]